MILSEDYHNFAGPSQLFLPGVSFPLGLLEDMRPPKRARPDEDNSGNSVVGQEETNSIPGLVPQTKDKGKKKSGRPQKGCEECKR